MRLSASFLLLLGATAAQYAVASPIRVVLVASNSAVSTNVSFGDARPVQIVNHEATAAATAQVMSHGAGRHAPCAQIREKALVWSNKFREVLGLPPIEPNYPIHDEPLPFLPPPPPRLHADGRGPEFHILPFIGTPPVVAAGSAPLSGGGRLQILPVEPPMTHPMMNHHHHNTSFLHRAHRALMILGPWEGRAVAFVLGCGIGVLLRMVWVMTVVIARAFRGGRSAEEDDVHDILVFEADAENIIVPPPQYTDEKIAITVPGEVEHK